MVSDSACYAVQKSFIPVKRHSNSIALMNGNRRKRRRQGACHVVFLAGTSRDDFLPLLIVGHVRRGRVNVSDWLGETDQGEAFGATMF